MCRSPRSAHVVHELDPAEIIDMVPSPRHSTPPVMTAWDHLLESPKHSAPESPMLTAWDHLVQSPKSMKFMMDFSIMKNRLVAAEAELQTMKEQRISRETSLALETVTTLAQTAADRPRVQQAVQAQGLNLAKSLARRWTLQIRLRQ